MTAACKNRLNGFTLLEVMIALAFFTVGILAVFSLAHTGMKSISLAQSSFYDSTAGARFIECILARPYSEGASDKENFGYDPLAPDCVPKNLEYGSMIEWNVLDDVSTAGTQRIRVNVRGSSHKSSRLMTYEYVRAKEFR
jgi:hypothetical protein